MICRKWEKYSIQTVTNPFPSIESAIVIVGSDKRGTIYGIVVGTSHHEPMQRAQQDWTIGGSGYWSYETNETNLKAFWRQIFQHIGSKE